MARCSPPPRLIAPASSRARAQPCSRSSTPRRFPPPPPARAYLQSAVLYTTPSGERRVRVHNLAVQVVELAGSVFRFADMEAVVAGLLRHAMARMMTTKMSTIRDELTESCSAILYAYRRNCAANTAATQLIIPEAFRALPMYALGMHKSKPLKARNVSPDVRAYTMHRFLSSPVRYTMFHLYPRLLAIHDLDDTIALPNPDTGVIEMPSLMRDSYVFMEAGGIYLADNEELQVLWIGQSTSPQLLRDLFAVDDTADIDPYMVRASSSLSPYLLIHLCPFHIPLRRLTSRGSPRASRSSYTISSRTAGASAAGGARRCASRGRT
ncbi:hypothetical protein EVG20_g7584 [Dentipellis fragilis]|uniref:Sec23/Sec24 helical domain-containing protein n=1 Tax=Dentipellis fragilis TaxID=205917 RepID=A0A4Y9YGG9_9AGAM|nr:hypothetical protein EVG20_g7584 [Dentipellis fragilis]